ncbi:MAG: hypothetical protein IPL06_01925 [Betaproteobacteria bacterium]|nr:hypothetical protein [Betaproteobacteria bacterium]
MDSPGKRSSPRTRAAWSIAFVALALASWGAFAAISSGAPFHTLVRKALQEFVGPGATIWWFSFGSLFNAIPSRPGEVVFASLANAAVWLLVCWLAAKIRKRFLTRSRPS